MIDLFVATEVSGTAEEVWSVLTDLARFSEWNPFIRRAGGELRPGGEIRVRVRTSLGLPLPFRARVLVCREGQELSWRGHFVHPRLACGEHSFHLEPLGERRVRVVQRETFTGLLPGLAGGLLERETRKGFARMNDALKRRVEGADGRPAGPAHAWR